MPPEGEHEQRGPEVDAQARGFDEALRTFRLPYYGRVWTSNLIQFVCFQVLFLALQWLVTSMTPLRSAVGLVGFVQGGTIALLSPAAGVIVDRRPKRTLIVIGRSGLAAVAMTIGMLVYTESIEYWHLLVVSVVGGLLASLLNPATQTFVVDVVGRRRTQHAVALNAMGSSFGSMGGGAVAGVLVGTVGMVATFVSASLGVVLAALVILTIPITGRSTREGERTSPLSDLREGFAYVRGRPPLLLALLACAMAVFNGAISPMRPIFARHVLGVGPEEFGVMSGALQIFDILRFGEAFAQFANLPECEFVSFGCTNESECDPRVARGRFYDQCFGCNAAVTFTGANHGCPDAILYT